MSMNKSLRGPALAAGMLLAGTGCNYLNDGCYAPDIEGQPGYFRVNDAAQAREACGESFHKGVVIICGDLRGEMKNVIECDRVFDFENDSMPPETEESVNAEM